MPTLPALLACSFAAALGVMAAVVVARQWGVARRLARDRLLTPEERAFLAAGVRRRLILAANLLLAAGVLAGAYLSGLEDRASLIADGRRERPAGVGPTEEERAFLRLYGGYWSAVVVSVVSLMVVAAWDLFAIRQYGLRQLRLIQDDRRKMLRDELARHRRRGAEPPAEG